MENTRNKPARRLPLAVYLAFLLVAALAFTGASFASYKTEATSSDSARVARFVVTAKPETNQSEDLTLDSKNPSAEYKFTVSNVDAAANDVNETATKYSVVVTLPSALPTGVTMKLTRVTDTTAINNTQSGNVYTFSDDDMLFSAAVARPDTYTLTFTAASSAVSGTLEGIKITVNAEQVD